VSSRPTIEELLAAAVGAVPDGVARPGQQAMAAAVANAAPCSRKSRPPNSRSREAASAAICSSLETSHGSTSGFSSFAASSRPFSSSRSLGYVSARRAPAAAAVCAIAHEIERLLATPTISPNFPAKSVIDSRLSTLDYFDRLRPGHGRLARRDVIVP